MLCPQCGTDNRLGAIFCRSCGLKLDIDSIDSESFEEKTGVKLKEGPKLSKIILKVVLVIVILGIAALITLIALVPEIERSETRQEGQDSLKSFEAKQNWAKKSIPQYKTYKYKYQLEFSEVEVNSYIADEFEEVEIKKGPIKFDEVDVDLISGNKMEARFFGKIWGKALLLRITGEVELNDGSITIAPVAVKIGKLPIPGFLAKPLFKNVIEIPQEKTKFLKEFDSIKIEDGSLTAILEGEREYKPKPRSRQP